MHISKKHVIVLILVAVMAATILLPRIFQLDHFVTPDELLWVARSANFYSALRNNNFEATYQKEHPGVTVMWAGAAAFLLKVPEYGRGGFEQVNWEGLQSQLEKDAQIKPLELLASARLVIVLLITAILSLAFYLAQRLIGLLPAVIAFLLIAFDPFQIGLSRLLHLDALLASFMFLSLLAYLCFLHEKKVWYLITSAIAAGLACLTKSPGILLVPVIGILALVDVRSSLGDQSAKPAKYIRRFISIFAGWLLIMAVVAVILWPAIWQKPVFVLASIFTNTEVHILEGHPTPAFFNGHIYQDGDITSLSFYILSFFWRTTPAVLLGLFVSAWAIITRRKPFDQPFSRFVAFGCLLLVVIFATVMTLAAKKFDRYILPVFPPLCLLSGAGWAALLYTIREKFSQASAKFAPAKFAPAILAPALLAPLMLLLLIAGSQVYASLGTFPYYLSYYNPVMGGSQGAPQVMLIGWGEGLDQAGRYLSQKPNARKLRVLAYLPYGSLSYYFPGKVRPIQGDDPSSQIDLAHLDTVDYVVIYVQQWQQNIPQSLLEYLSPFVPEKTVWINGIEYARIYAVH